MAASQISLVDFLMPFNSLTHFNKASEIVLNNYSDKKKNFSLVTKLINEFIKNENFANSLSHVGELSQEHVVHFIQKIRRHKTFYGYDFVLQREEFLTVLYKHNLNQGQYTKTIAVPHISCAFCVKGNINLVVKRMPFEKEVLLYGYDRIGTTLKNQYLRNRMLPKIR